MIYLKTRAQFLTDKNNIGIIKEAFESDITWGGSLLGRFINSTIRKGRILYNKGNVNAVIKRLEDELNSLFISYMDEQNKEKVNFVKIKGILHEIKQSVERGDPIEIYIGNGEAGYGGLVSKTIDTLDRIKDFPDKDLVKQKLEKFKKDLEELVKNKNITLGTGEEAEEENADDETADKFLKTKLSQLLNGSSTVQLPAGQSADPFEKMVKGDYSFINDNKLNQDQVLSNYRDMLTDKGFTDYLNKKNQKLLQSIQKITKTQPTEQEAARQAADKKGLTASNSKPDDENSNDRGGGISGSEQGNNNNKPVKPTGSNQSNPNREAAPVHGSRYNDAYQYLTEGVNQDGIKAFIQQSGKEVSKAITDWLNSLAGSVAMDNKNRLKQIFLKNLKVNTDAENVQFKYDKNDTLEKLAYGLAMIKKQDIINYKRDKPDAKTGDIYSTLLRQKIDQAGDKIEMDEQTKKHFDGIVKSIVGINKIKTGDTNNETSNPAQNKKPVQQRKTNEATDNNAEQQMNTQQGNTNTSGAGNQNANQNNANNNNQQNSGGDVKQEVQKIWSNNFSSEDENKYCLTQQEASKVEKEVEHAAIDIRTDEQKDPIIRIADIFGDAYRLYKTDTIPSGRPDGKVSNATLREYIYIGSEKPPDSGKQQQHGPYAAKAVYEPWRKGIMKILENTKFRQILANPNLSINGQKGAGKMLMEFINGMLRNIKGDYDDQRYKLLQKYFGLSKDDSKKMERVDDKKNKTANGADLKWIGFSSISKSEMEKGRKFDNTFIKLKCSGNDKNLILSSYIREYDDRKDALLIKFSFGGNALANAYLKDLGAKIEESTGGKIYVGVISMSGVKALSKGQSIKLAYNEFKWHTNDPHDDQTSTIELKINDISVLSTVDAKTKQPTPYVMEDKIKTRPEGDSDIDTAIYIRYLSQKL